MKRYGLSAIILFAAVQAHAIEPYRAQSIQPYQAREIQPYRAQEVKPARTPDIQVDRSVPPIQNPASVPDRQEKSSAGKPKGGAQGLVGLWQTNIPGAVYTIPSGFAGYDTLHVSTGAAAGLLRINATGTYSWNSYGGKKGKWVESGDGEYPIEIIDTVENRRWKVGYSSAKKALIIWSGSYWYEGKRAAVKKK